MWIEGRAVYREGKGLPGRSVTIALDLRGLVVRGLSGEEIASWPFGTLVVDPFQSAFTLLGRGQSGRVEIADPATRAAFEAALKALPRTGDPRVPRSITYTVLVVVALIVVLAALAWRGIGALAGGLAPMVPSEIVQALDEGGRAAVLEQLGTGSDRRCSAPEGWIALATLTDRLAESGAVREIDWKVDVYRSAVPNAVALPGGSIVVTDALLSRVGSADAFAGVLAHEIGHVHHRHGVRKVLHEGGLLLALTMLTGDATGLAGGATRLLLGAAYSRDAEREADAFAVFALARAGGDPRALGPFLVDLDRDAGATSGFWSLVATHPMSAERRSAIDAASQSAERGEGPLIPEAEWDAIRAICE